MGARVVYRALLHCYPAAFRHEYGDQMQLVFAEQLREARRTGNRLQQAGLWAQAAADVLIIAPREHGHVIVQDLRYAARTMAARPGFTIVAVLSLALGIGANTAIFSLWNGLLRAPLPAVDAPGELVMLSDPNQSGLWRGGWNGKTDGPRAWLTYGEFEDLRDHATSFSGLMASQSSLETWTIRVDGGSGEEAHGRLVSGGFFEVLGVRAAIGRLFTASDDRTDAATAVISHQYWQRRFGGRSDVLGKTMIVRNAALTIIGVTPPRFVGETAAQQPDFWLPLRQQPAVLPGSDRLHDTPPNKAMWLNVFGRLKPGVTAVQAEAEANAIFQAGLVSFYGARLSGPGREAYLDQRLQLVSAARGASSKRPEFSQSLTALLGAVGVLLLIACANLANLLLTRGAQRKSEIALRLSLGARRGRIVRQLMTESLALAGMGGAAAVVVAYLLQGALVRRLAQADSRIAMNFALDPAIALFVIGATVAAALVFGGMPAWQVTNTDPGTVLKDHGRGASGARGQIRSRRALVTLQLALSLPLLMGAGLLAQTVYNLQNADLGFPTSQLVVARVDVREAAPDAAGRANVLRQLSEAFQRIRGVRAVGYSHLGVFSGGNSIDSVAVEGHTPATGETIESARDIVGPGYFTALGVPMRLGRDVLPSDRGDAAKVVVINEAFATRFFDRRNPLGLRLTSITEQGTRTDYQIVGVAGNARTQSLRGDIEPRYFLAAEQPPNATTSPTFFLRTSIDAAPVIAAARAAIAGIDSTLPILFVESIDDHMSPLTVQDRTTAILAVVFGFVALALAAVGLYGVLSFGIAVRAGEIAIRIALGAEPGRVIGMILRETAGLIGAGLVVGGGLAYAASRAIDSRLYGVAPRDPLTLAAAITLLVSVALVATLVPAWRASRLEPMAALRQ